MADIKFDGFEEFEKVMNSLTDDKTVVGLCKMALYDGAGAAAEEIVKEIKGHTTQKNPAKGMTKAEQSALISGFGISAMEEKGGDINVKIGFAGYDTKTRTKKFPKGVPIPLTARSLEKGTSWRVRDPFMSKAVNRARKKVPDAMDKRLEEEIKKIVKKG